jgi:beta-galactosidase
VRWVALTDRKGDGLLVSADRHPLSIGARHYSTQTMRESMYSFQMERLDDIFLNIDAGQSGVGGINSWGSVPLEQYRLNRKTYRYAYRMRPLTGDVESALSSQVAYSPSNVEALAVPDVSKLPEIKTPQNNKKAKK